MAGTGKQNSFQLLTLEQVTAFKDVGPNLAFCKNSLTVAVSDGGYICLTEGESKPVALGMLAGVSTPDVVRIWRLACMSSLTLRLL